MSSRKLKFISTTAIVAAAVCANSTFANSITTPPGLAPGAPFYVVFVTNTTTTATSDSLSDYDKIAQSDADANGLGIYDSTALTWSAIGSSAADGYYGTSANDRMPASSAPVYLPDGTLVADSVSDLWLNGVTHAVDEAADGTTVNTDVWTGTSGNGEKASVFPDYNNTLGGSSVEYGQSGVTGTGWIDSESTMASTTELPIYAFTEIVPLPSSAAMGAVGLGLLAAYAASRKLLKLSYR